jgi:hypothetical protein
MKTIVLRNSYETISVVSRQAFICPEPWLAVWILSYLAAVSTRVASAVLTVYDPTRYTVMDVRAWAALEQLDLRSYGRIDRVDLDSPDVCRLPACLPPAGR